MMCGQHVCSTKRGNGRIYHAVYRVSMDIAKNFLDAQRTKISRKSPYIFNDEGHGTLYSSFFPSNIPTVHKKEFFFSFTTIHDDDVIFSPILTQEGTKK